MNRNRFYIGLIILLVSLPFFFLLRPSDSVTSEKAVVDLTPRTASITSPYCTDIYRIQSGEFFADMLHQVGVKPADAYTLISNTKEEFDPRNFRAGKEYNVLINTESQEPEYLIYPLDKRRNLEYDLKNLCLTEKEKDIEVKIRSYAGVIQSSLWLTMQQDHIPLDLIDKLESVFAWTIDFYHIQKGDRFKLIYEELIAEGESIGTGKILGAVFENNGTEFHAINFKTTAYDGYYDLQARPMKRAFLKAPVKYSRISSRYNPRRFHPVLKRTKAHLGTDYAAPGGTPIYAVANGVISRAGYTRGNGNYVKIKHSDEIQTQYLHMRNIKKGISPGVHVQQGDVIGYVGKTGLATGNHVCFRFWKNGRQVDHLKENLPPPEPMAQEDIPHFNVVKDLIREQLSQVEYPISPSETEVSDPS